MSNFLFHSPGCICQIMTANLVNMFQKPTNKTFMYELYYEDISNSLKIILNYANIRLLKKLNKIY